ncbi:microtubule-destabilizing protein 60-like isoform X2 [Cornus florida]|nr:microtubule-destabilizing protein 60-like isoform X2 [Cornus florida]
MDLIGNSVGATPSKYPQSNRSKVSKISKPSENFNPNITSPCSKHLNSPAIKSAAKPHTSSSKNPNPSASPSPRNKIRERKFVVAKRNLKKGKANPSTVSCKCEDKVGGNSEKCLCVAYEILRASQEGFFKNRGGANDECESEEPKNPKRAETQVEEEEEKNPSTQNLEIANGCEGKVNQREDKMPRVLESRSGRVMHLIKAFERLHTIPNSKDLDQEHEQQSEDHEKALPELQPRVPETQVSPSSFSPPVFFLTPESLGLSSSSDDSQGSISSRTSGGGDQRSRRNSSESSGTFGGKHCKRRQLRATCQKPFKLKTEQRGRYKEEEFVKKVQEMMMEEEKQRIPTAQGLPWTTDEPECLMKPPVKEITRPIDLMMHSDLRAQERAEFDQQVAEKMILIKEYRMERERQQKLAEEEEIKRLRKELIPKAQPMPYFDRPFIPRK